MTAAWLYELEKYAIVQIFDHQTYVRSGILLTVALVGANAMMTLRVLNRFDR